MTISWTLVAALVILSVFHERALRRQAKLATERDQAVKVRDTVMSESLDARRASQNAIARADFHERRAAEFFGIIEGVEKERDTWQKLYRESSQHAGAAQAWLLRDLGYACRLANTYARRLRDKSEQAPDVSLDPTLAEVVREFGVHTEGTAEVPRAPGMEAAKTLQAQAIEAEGVPTPRAAVLPPVA